MYDSPSSASSGSSSGSQRYVAPSTRGDVLSARVVLWLTSHGVSLLGSRVLLVRGRRSGNLQQVPVNLLQRDGHRYVVAPRGATQWVRNVRAAGAASLQLGRRVEPVTMTELPVEQRVPVLGAYLARWGWEVGRFVDGLTKDATDAELLAAAPGIPVFEVHRPVEG